MAALAFQEGSFPNPGMELVSSQAGPRGSLLETCTLTGMSVLYLGTEVMSVSSLTLEALCAQLVGDSRGVTALPSRRMTGGPEKSRDAGRR